MGLKSSALKLLAPKIPGARILCLSYPDINGDEEECNCGALDHNAILNGLIQRVKEAAWD